MLPLRPIEFNLISALFQRSPGYVLDFTNQTFRAFFLSELRIDIDDPTYLGYGTSKWNRLRCFLDRGQPAAVVKALISLWEYREASLRRHGENDPIQGAREEFSTLIQRLGGPSVMLHRKAEQQTTGPQEPDDAFWTAMKSGYETILPLPPQARGYAFEGFLASLFEGWKLAPRKAFKLEAEQIDGSFTLGEFTYILEAKWQNAKTDLAALRSFQAKVEERPDWTLGLFVGYSGFTDQALSVFPARRTVLMDGFDLHQVLEERLSLPLVLGFKKRRMAESRLPFVSVREFIR